MKATIREITLTNGEPIASFAPRQSEFETTVQLIIGPEHGPGEELFDVTVCSAAAYLKKMNVKGYAWSHAILAVDQFEPGLITRALKELVGSVEGSEWNALVQQLRKFLRWEFDEFNQRKA